jgi:hypothetical protein
VLQAALARKATEYQTKYKPLPREGGQTEPQDKEELPLRTDER